MLVLYSMIGIVSFIIGITIIVLVIQFLSAGINYFRLANKKIKLELATQEKEIIETNEIKQEKLNNFEK
ncbi:hypothetical protein [Spiroplasma platyhelix]|uniref:Uncharacterized protein n=1 Tax=Spiroplasma platyhelix PALS-1 TaxID=1276218 RepID=A0A846TXH8_9MOLU|nr:hypothetical protein [Spiroplasma platyhelix]MBE4704409.1 hypothetical protein [Spiroplasma platyhelix PALS-1]NKE38781.1 hypothetical protein [Spiroplasma platyhelix PALS-1]UJB28992.1 hypothetical protein SPLAT_v1c02270 [Spiroplasma platyhelix PALS-1]